MIRGAARFFSLAPRRLAVLAIVAVAAAYQVHPVLEIRAADLLATWALEGFSAPEGDFRWSGARSQVVFADPGPGRDVDVELELAGWRPRGQRPPNVSITSGPLALLARTNAQTSTLRFQTSTYGVWRSDLHVSIEAETFTPGPRDPRQLGVRLHAARLYPRGPRVAPAVPPLRALVLVPLLVLVAYGLALRFRASPRAAERLAAALALGLGTGFAVWRLHAATALAPLCVAALALWLAVHMAPRAADRIAAVLGGAALRLARGVRTLGLAALPLALAGSVAITLAYRSGPVVDVDLGSERDAVVAHGFGTYDAGAGATFRVPLRGSRLDLRDFGAGDWTLSVTGQAAGEPWEGVLSRAAGSTLQARLDERWTTDSYQALAPFGWRSGLEVELGGDSRIRIDRVRIDRGRSLPALRVLAAALGAALGLAVAFGAVGLSRRSALLAAALVLAAETAALLADPLAAIPFAVPFCAIALAGMALSALMAATLGMPPASLAAAAAGFVAWLTATASPLYRGGNFLFHSNIAEEIWKGRLLVYYLPFPGSMLSRQAQWGDIVVPHPCLEQIVMAPLAALPLPWFHLAEKAVLALMLACMTLLASLVAERAAGPAAAAYASVLMVGLVPGFLLLGLGHLMTLFGCWASSLALVHLALRIDRLAERKIFWTSVALLTLAFLSYFASLLFTGLVVAVASLVFAITHPGVARRLALAVAAASACAFLIYYVYWAGPFLSQSVPRILAGSHGAHADPTPVWHRLLQEPRKIGYSFGSILVPLVGFAGLARVKPGADRVVLWSWAAVLPAVCVLDVFFNFILKHHYFVMVPVAAGAGIALGALADRGRAGRVAAAVLATLAVLLAAETALAVAIGEIP